MKWILKRIIYLVIFGGVLFIPLVVLTDRTGDHSEAGDDTGFMDSISSWLDEVGNSISSIFSGDEKTAPTLNDPAMTTPDPDGQSPHLDGGIFSDIGQILSFDTTPKDIANRWALVSFHVKNNGLHSYRVPVVTGEKQDDLAGAITYLFDEHEKLQRIEFLGYTEDASTLITVMKQKFHMTQRPSRPGALFVKSRHKLPISALRIVRPEVINASSESSGLEVRFELNRAHLGTTLSDEFRQLLATDRNGSQI